MDMLGIYFSFVNVKQLTASSMSIAHPVNPQQTSVGNGPSKSVKWYIIASTITTVAIRIELYNIYDIINVKYHQW